MPEYAEALHRTIIVVDVARFTASTRKVHDQVAIHGGLETLLRDAFDHAGIGWDACDVEDRGDGKLILVPPGVPKIRLVDELWGRLLTGLRRHNATYADASTMQLRVAVHAGEVRLGENGKVSRALNDAFRIVEAPEAKTALADSGAMLALIASDLFYHDVIEPDPAAVPDAFRQISVDVKQFTGIAWLRLPATLTPTPDERTTSAPSGEATTSPTTIPRMPAQSVPRPAAPVPQRDEPPVRELLPEVEVERLRAWLDGVAVTQLPTLFRRAAGPGVPPIRRGATAVEVFSHLADFNAGPDGLPPALAFIELLARQVRGPLAEQLTRWNDEQAQGLRLEEELARRRIVYASPVDAGARLHLLIVVQHDGIDSDRYLFSHWRQDDPDQWAPIRGESGIVTVGELERHVDAVLGQAEEAWEGHDGEVALEMVLPRALLNLPVHAWHRDLDSVDPRPLFVDYPIVVRSLERMMSRRSHRKWRQRWRALMADPSAALVHFAQPTDPDRPDALAILLEQEPEFASIVLSAPPPILPRRGDQLTAALRSGLPAVLWYRGDADDYDSLREVVDWLVEDGGLADLPGRAQALRRSAYLGMIERFNPNVIRDLVVMWDSPERGIALDQLVG